MEPGVAEYCKSLPAGKEGEREGGKKRRRRRRRKEKRGRVG